MRICVLEKATYPCVKSQTRQPHTRWKRKRCENPLEEMIALYIREPVSWLSSGSTGQMVGSQAAKKGSCLSESRAWTAIQCTNRLYKQDVRDGGD